MKVGGKAWLRVEPKAEEPYQLVTVKAINAEQVTLMTDMGEETNAHVSADVFNANKQGDTADDHCGLIHMNEPTILENTRVRFATDLIYTYVGNICVALNPFASLPIYGDALMAMYKDKEIGARGCPPHLYAMAESSYKVIRRFQSGKYGRCHETSGATAFGK